VVWLNFNFFGVDPRSIRSKESMRDERAPRGADPVGDVAGHGSSGGSRNGGKYASTRTTLEVGKQSVEDRATAAQTAAGAAITERDALSSSLALAEAEFEKLRAAVLSAEEAIERARTALLPPPKLLPGTPPRLQPERRRHSKQRCRTWSATWAPPRRIWRQSDANSPRSPISSRSPRRRHGYTRATPSCQRTTRVS
jgi:hypothetical protein